MALGRLGADGAVFDERPGRGMGAEEPGDRPFVVDPRAKEGRRPVCGGVRALRAELGLAEAEAAVNGEVGEAGHQGEQWEDLPAETPMPKPVDFQTGVSNSAMENTGPRLR